MDNMHQAVYDLISTCPLVGYDMYFNFIDQGNNDCNTSLLSTSYGDLIQKYVDGDRLMRISYEIRQVKPLAVNSNTIQNVEQLELVQQFMNWINEQGKNNNFPDFGDRKTIQKMGTSDGVVMPTLASYYDNTALYAFPFEIIYVERN